jgi:hypothetical protein
MAMEPRKIADGYLVALSTSIENGPQYGRADVTTDLDGTAERKSWRATKYVAHVAEYERAVDLRSKARTVVARHCAFIGFCFLCRDDRLPRLQTDMEDLQSKVAEFNSTATSAVRVTVNALIGRLARDDAATIAVVRAEVDGLLSAMKNGAETGDVEAMRSGAKKARNAVKMLTPAMEADFGETITKVQKAAKRLVKAADTAAAQVDADVLADLDGARMRFLDLSEPMPLAAEPVPAPARQLDLGEAPAVAPNTEAKSRKTRKRKAETRALDIEAAS